MTKSDFQSQLDKTQSSPSAGWTWTDASFVFMRGGVLCLALAIAAGALGVLFYYPGAAAWFKETGLHFPRIRPLHTGFVMAWIFLGGVSIVHRYFQDEAAPLDSAGRARIRVQMWLWALAGVGALVSILMGVTSGREYLGFHPLFSIPILLGWLMFAFNFFRATIRDFLGRPVYVTMWGAGVLFFIYTFTEQHAFMIQNVLDHPVMDIRLQWKSVGTLVGSFNLFVYGTLIFVGERISGDKTYAHSKMAYALFGVGLLNSFTNYAHHTYHVPQSETVKWIAFVVSMTEILILVRVVWDITRTIRKKATPGFIPARCFLTATKWWTAAMLATALLLSVPPLNSLVHGTHVVTAHAMGTEIGIDTMVLLAALAWLLEDRRRGGRPDPEPRPRDLATRRWGIALNIAAASLVVWLHISGISVGINRYTGNPIPAWIDSMGPHIFATAGIATALCVVVLIARSRGELCVKARSSAVQRVQFPAVEADSGALPD